MRRASNGKKTIRYIDSDDVREAYEARKTIIKIINESNSEFRVLRRNDFEHANIITKNGIVVGSVSVDHIRNPVIFIKLDCVFAFAEIFDGDLDATIYAYDDCVAIGDMLI